MEFAQLDPQHLLKMLACPDPSAGPVDMVLDTDTYNEIDDQFAVVYALQSTDRINCHALYAAPFHNNRSTGPEDGMVKSYEEILRLMELMGRETDGFVFEGSRGYLPAADVALESPAAADLVAKAKAHDISNGPLYVVAIGAITNVASAILMDPSIIEKITVVWLGGQPHYWHSTREFNLSQDLHAARVILESGVAFVQLTCNHVARLLRTTVPELREYISGKNPLADFLFERFCSYSDDHMAWAKEIWDLAPIAWLINPDWCPSCIKTAPTLTDQHTWSNNPFGKLMRVSLDCNRNAIFKDVFNKLAK